MINSDPRSLAGRPLEKSRRLGQVCTPEAIAAKMVRQLFSGRIEKPVRILDPCAGPYTFPQQIIESGVIYPKDTLTIIDSDDEMIVDSQRRARVLRCKADFVCGDYLDISLDGTYDYAILNPPYIRQEWLDKKETYRELFETRYDLQIPGTSNLYVYFIVKVVKDLKPGGEFACIVYDSWQSTRYGKWLQDFLQKECDKVEMVQLSQQPFQGRLIDATLIFARKRAAGLLGVPSKALLNDESSISLSSEKGLLPLGSVYRTKRGLRLKQADFFLCDLKRFSGCGASPFIKKVSKVIGYVVPDEHPEAALLLQSSGENPKLFSELKSRLIRAQQEPEKNISILTWYRERPHSWMVHAKPPYAPILFNYYLRKRPRHLFNPTRLYSDNFYGLDVPNGISPLACLASLNSTAVCAAILARSRNQGSGLAKIQLFEYRGVYVPDMMQFESKDIKSLEGLGRELVETPRQADATISRIDALLASALGDGLAVERVREIFIEADRKARRPKEG